MERENRITGHANIPEACVAQKLQRPRTAHADDRQLAEGVAPRVTFGAPHLVPRRQDRIFDTGREHGHRSADPLTKREILGGPRRAATNQRSAAEDAYLVIAAVRETVHESDSAVGEGWIFAVKTAARRPYDLGEHLFANVEHRLVAEIRMIDPPDVHAATRHSRSVDVAIMQTSCVFTIAYRCSAL